MTLVPDRQDYRAGDKAHILVVPPFTPAHGVLTLWREGLLSQQTFSIEAGSTTLTIPIEDSFVPNLVARVDLVGSAPRVMANGEVMAERRPAYASGELNLPIPPVSRALKVEVTQLSRESQPGVSSKTWVTVRDAAGKPVQGAEVAVAVVDEAILALVGGTGLPDPLLPFYPLRSWDGRDSHSRALVTLPSLGGLYPGLAEPGPAWPARTSPVVERPSGIARDGCGGVKIMRNGGWRYL